MTIEFSYECEKPRRFPKVYVYDIGYLATIVQASQLALDQACSQPDIEKFRYWFGDFKQREDSAYQESILHVNKMREHAETHRIVFNQTPALTLAMTDQKEAALKINLGTYLSMGIYSLGEMVVTLMHELSHKTPGLMTKDISIGTDFEGNPERAYKSEAVNLARKDPAKAIQNAENWGYYIASYHKEAGLSDLGSWAHTESASEIGKKPKEPESGAAVRGEHWAGGIWVKHENRGCVPDEGNNPIVRYVVQGNRVNLERATTPLADEEVRPIAPVVAMHVKKAPVNDGPHKCPKCDRGFKSIVARGKHTPSCSG